MKILPFISMILLLFVACNKEHTVEKIDSDILVSAELVEDKVFIHGESEKVYPTLGHQITYCQKARRDEIYIEFKKVLVPEIGLTALGPALCDIQFEDLADGEYEVTFNLNKRKIKGKLVLGTTVELTIESGGNVKPG